jgi:hypothetical protein
VLTTVWSLLPTVRLLQTSALLSCPLLFALAIIRHIQGNNFKRETAFHGLHSGPALFKVARPLLNDEVTEKVSHSPFPGISGKFSLCHEYRSFRCDFFLRCDFLLLPSLFFSVSTFYLRILKIFRFIVSDVQHLGTGLAYPALWCWACQFRKDTNDLWTP